MFSVLIFSVPFNINCPIMSYNYLNNLIWIKGGLHKKSGAPIQLEVYNICKSIVLQTVRHTKLTDYAN